MPCVWYSLAGETAPQRLSRTQSYGITTILWLCHMSYVRHVTSGSSQQERSVWRLTPSFTDSNWKWHFHSQLFERNKYYGCVVTTKKAGKCSRAHGIFSKPYCLCHRALECHKAQCLETWASRLDFMVSGMHIVCNETDGKGRSEIMYRKRSSKWHWRLPYPVLKSKTQFPYFCNEDNISCFIGCCED